MHLDNDRMMLQDLDQANERWIKRRADKCTLGPQFNSLLFSVLEPIFLKIS